MKIINKSILLFSIICFSWIFIFSLFLDSNVFYSENSFISLLISPIIIGIWYFIFQFIQKKKKITVRNEICFLIFYFLLVTIIQIVVLKELNVIPGWDFGVVYDNALKYAQTGTREGAVYSEYFQLFPNNIPIFLLMVIVIKIGMIVGFSGTMSIRLMNIVFIDGSLFLLFLTARRMYNSKVAIFSLIVSLFFVALFLYTPIVYSDTLSLFVGLLFIYIFTFIKDDNLSKKNILLLILIGIVVFIGKSLKVTSLIVFIALLGNYFLTHKIKTSIIFTGIIAMTFLIINLAFNKIIVPADRFSFKVNNYGSYPYTHWVMMGVEDKDADNSGRNTYGGYNVKDYEKTLSFKSGKKAQKFNIEEYKKRVGKLGFIGYIEFLTKKNVNIWTDGYYFSNIKLSILPVKRNSTLRRFILDNNTKYYGIYFTQGVTYAFLLLLIVGSFFLLKKKKYKNVDYLRLSLLGILFFLSFWEGRSRYLVNYIPIFILIIVQFYDLLFTDIISIKKKHHQK